MDFCLNLQYSIGYQLLGTFFIHAILLLITGVVYRI